MFENILDPSNIHPTLIHFLQQFYLLLRIEIIVLELLIPKNRELENPIIPVAFFDELTVQGFLEIIFRFVLVD